jgi:glycosyltransferase involved in cell wall biosynthesis
MAAHGPERLIIRHCGNAHRYYCRHLVERHGFTDLCRHAYDPGDKSKAAHLLDAGGDLLFALKHLRVLRSAKHVIAIGPTAAAVAVLLRMGLLGPSGRLWWLGFFVHSPCWLRRLRLIFRILNAPRIHFIVFSQYEMSLYVNSLGLRFEQLHYLPYGDMNPKQSKPDVERAQALTRGMKGYFFSGGDTSRDYKSLINEFRHLPYPLVVVCGARNGEVPITGLPANVTVFREVAFEVFEGLAQCALACIVPIAYDTGAAGQSVCLSHMRHGKVIIATDTRVIREYIEDGVSGILVKDNGESLSRAVRTVAMNPARYDKLGQVAREEYLRRFTAGAIAERLNDLVNHEMAD